MLSKVFLHDLPDFKLLIETVAGQNRIIPQIIEKDYWLMHSLWGLKHQGLIFQLKGGTSLSKGWKIINRFSEDVDIRIAPPKDMLVKIGKNQDRPAHRESRERFFNWLTSSIKIPGIFLPSRNLAYGDNDQRNAAIELGYSSYYDQINGIKPHILLEVGFDDTTPNEALTISSWVMDHINLAAKELLKEAIIDNRSTAIPCYAPEYTLVEKLQAISTKYRQQQAQEKMPINFLRHYYDVFQLLGEERVIDFIGTPEYLAHKEKRFRASDEKDLTKNQAFVLSNPAVLRRYKAEFERSAALYYSGQPAFEEILARIETYLARL